MTSTSTEPMVRASHLKKWPRPRVPVQVTPRVADDHRADAGYQQQHDGGQGVQVNLQPDQRLVDPSQIQESGHGDQAGEQGGMRQRP
jgi:hypothetical protein